MRPVTWNDLEPQAATYLPVNIGRVTQGVVHTAHNVAADSESASHWLQQNTPTSLLGLDYIKRGSGTIRATLLDAPAYLHIFQGDPPVHLPAGTDVCAHYSGETLQYISYYIPVPDMRVRAVPPFCARVHDDTPLVPKGVDIRNAFSANGQIDLLMATRAIAVEAGSNSHVHDIDKRLALIVAREIGPGRRLAC